MELIDLELTVRAWNLLERSGIITVKQLEQKTAADLLRIPKMGRRSIEDIQEALARHGRHLRGEPVYVTEASKGVASFMESRPPAGLESHSMKPSTQVQREFRAAIEHPFQTLVWAMGENWNDALQGEKASAVMRVGDKTFHVSLVAFRVDPGAPAVKKS